METCDTGHLSIAYAASERCPLCEVQGRIEELENELEEEQKAAKELRDEIERLHCEPSMLQVHIGSPCAVCGSEWSQPHEK